MEESPRQLLFGSRLMQTRLGSLVEAATSILIGYAVSVTANYFILPLYPPPITWQVSAEIGLWFTALALTRQYIVRRWFNKRLHRQS
jgi:hypothetical protein